MMMPRIVLFAAGLVSIVFAPPWVPFLFAVALAARWFAWEAVLLGLAIDLVYLAAPGTFFNIPFPATLATVVILLVCEPLRQRLLDVRG